LIEAAPSDLVDCLVAEMAAAWRQGDRRSVESYLDRHPEVCDHPEEAIRLVYEEVCLRQECGPEVAADELARRFPQWADELAVLLDCHRLMQTRLSPPAFPGVGESLGDFRIVAELGRGSHGRVFLASQPALADRPVVLKVTPSRAREHLSLARLQHTHIIPLHAVYEFPARNLRALCMPFLGGATLASVLGLMGDQPMARRTGQSLLDALDAAQNGVPVRVPGRGGYLRALAGASYVEAVCWLGACLADGLQYAHERGLVHLDLKPSNVLLAADAQPLLLDFHLALRPLPAGLAAPEWLGGTPRYMSPEQASACEAARRGRPIPEAVDGRSDLYSLGQLLYVALAEREETADSPLPALHRCNPQVSAGLSDIIHKCLATRPEGRYPDAAALAKDLRRHLAHLPLEGVPNRDPRERWRKWRRRRPNAPLWTGLLLALAAAGAVLAAGAVDRYREAQGSLTEGQDQMQRGAYSEALHTLARGKSRAEGIPGAAPLVQALDEQARLARRAQAVVDLHAVAEGLRFLAGADIRTTGDLRALEAQCRTAWEARNLVVDREAASLGDTDEHVRADLLDLALFWTDLIRGLARKDGREDGRAEVEAVLAEAEKLLGPSAALTRERQLLAGGVPSTPAAGGLASWERVALAQSLLRSGDLERAAEQLERAAELRPQDFWANFSRGVCAYRREKYDAAVHCFGVAVALAPASPECYYNRALAYEACGDNAHALRDYDRALALAPHLGAAALNRGALHYKEGRYPEASSDLREALLRGAEPAAVHYNLALVHLALQDPDAARQDLIRTLSHNPAHAEALSLQAKLGRQK
jgi:serine/threonine protein kinase/Flp pilus assembly protein TadD